MKASARDQAKGKIHQVKGQLKEQAGKLAGNRELEAEGTLEKVVGMVQENFGKAEKLAGK